MSTSNLYTIVMPDGPIEVRFQEVTREQRGSYYSLVNRVFSNPSSPIVARFASMSLEEQDLIPMLRATPGTQHWCLTSTADPQSILASCRISRREVIVRDDQGTRRTHYHIISAVATDARFRGKGLAGFLIRKIAEWADREDGGDAALTVLYSAVGEYYVKFGWELHACPQVTLKLRNGENLPEALPEGSGGASALETRLLKKEDITALCNRDVTRLETLVEGYDLPEGKKLVTPVPTSEVISYFGDTASWINQHLNGEPAAEHRGAICDNADTWLFWYPHVLWGKLIVTRVVLGENDARTNVAALVELLKRAVRELESWQGALKELEIWDPSAEVTAALQILEKEIGVDVEHGERKGQNHTSLRWRDGSKGAIFWPNQFYAFD